MCGGIAQLARALGSYPWCRGFESPSRYHFYFAVGIVKRLRPWVVAPVYESSNLSTHPKNFLKTPFQNPEKVVYYVGTRHWGIAKR